MSLSKTSGERVSFSSLKTERFSSSLASLSRASEVAKFTLPDASFQILSHPFKKRLMIKIIEKCILFITNIMLFVSTKNEFSCGNNFIGKGRLSLIKSIQNKKIYLN